MHIVFHAEVNISWMNIPFYMTVKNTNFILTHFNVLLPFLFLFFYQLFLFTRLNIQNVSDGINFINRSSDKFHHLYIRTKSCECSIINTIQIKHNSHLLWERELAFSCLWHISFVIITSYSNALCPTIVKF